MTLLVLIRWVHLMAAVTWIGGMLFMTLVLGPLLPGLSQQFRGELTRAVGERLKIVGWVAIALLVLTGILNLALMGISPGALLQTPWGRLFLVKMGLVVVMVVLSALHDFVLGPRLVETMGNPTPSSLRQTVIWLARVNLAVGLLVFLAAVRLSHV